MTDVEQLSMLPEEPGLRYPPSHVLRYPGAKLVLCGLKTKEALPHVWARHVLVHVEGWGMRVCPACKTHMDGAP